MAEDIKIVGITEQQKQEDDFLKVNRKEAVPEDGAESVKVREAELFHAKKLQQAAVRKFHRENGQLWEEIGFAGENILHAVYDEITPEEEAATEAYKAGKRKLVTASDILAAAGARNVHEMVLVKATETAEITFKTEQLITSGKLTLKDLNLPTAELKEKLDASGSNHKVKKMLVQNKDAVKNSLETKVILLDFAAQNPGKADSDLVNFLSEKEVYHNQLFSGEFIKVTHAYFSSSTDQLLKRINPATMTSKELKGLIKYAENLGIETKDLIVIKELYRNKYAERIKQKTAYAHGIHGDVHALAKYLESATEVLGEDAAASGARQLTNVYNIGRTAYAMLKFAGKATGKTVTIAGRTVFLNPVSRYIGRKVKEEAVLLKNTAVTAIKSVEAVQQAEQVIGQTKDRIYQNRKVMALKQKAESVKKVTGNVKNKAATMNNRRKSVTRKLKSAGNKTMRVVKKPVRIVTSPVKGVSTLFYNVRDFFRNKLILPIAGAVLIFILIYVVLVAVSGLAMNLLDKSKEVVFLSPEDMQRLMEHVDEKENAVYEEALELATGEPFSGTVCYNIPLYCYGSPKSYHDPTSEYYHTGASINPNLLNGWNIYYLDSNGTVTDKTSNVKDIISLACVMLGNSTEDYEEYENLLDDMWAGMIPIITARESEIYHTIYSTDTYPLNGADYYCNDAGFYEDYNNAGADGVCFYDRVAAKKTYTPYVYGYETFGSGCEYSEWYEWELDCSIAGHEHTRACYTKEWYREYYCPGHSALHCSYGYRDINVYITLLTKEDVYAGTTTEEKTTMTYNIPTNFDATEFEAKIATMEYKQHLDGYRKRMEKFFGMGAWDYAKHLDNSEIDNATGLFSCEIPRLNQDGSVNMGIEVTERCNGNIEWCDSLYSENWEEIYGIE